MAKKKKVNSNVKVGAVWYSARTNLEHANILISMGVMYKPNQEMGVFYRKHGRDKYLLHPGPPGGQCILSKEEFQKLFTPTEDDGKIKGCNAASSAGFERSFWDYYETSKKLRSDDLD